MNERVRIEVSYSSNAVVFSAFVDPAFAGRWMYGPGTRVAEYCVEAKVGGRFSLVMTSGTNDWPHDGKALEYDPPQRLAFTWLSPSTSGVITQVMIHLQPLEGAKTALKLVHSGLGDNFLSFIKGWDALFDQLSQQLSV